MADVNGDGKPDLAVTNAFGNTLALLLNGRGAPADHDGDGRADATVYHPSGVWSILRSSDGVNQVLGLGGAAQEIPPH